MRSNPKDQVLKDHLRTKLSITLLVGGFSALVALLIALGVIVFPVSVVAMSLMLTLIAITAFAVRFAISYHFELTKSKVIAQAVSQAESDATPLVDALIAKEAEADAESTPAIRAAAKVSTLEEVTTTAASTAEQEYLSRKNKNELILFSLSLSILVVLISLSIYGVLPALSILEVAAMSMVAGSLVYIKLDLFFKDLRDQVTTPESTSWFSNQKNQGKFVIGLGLTIITALAFLVVLEVALPSFSLGLAVFGNVPLLLGFTALAAAICLRGFVLYCKDGDEDKHRKALFAAQQATDALVATHSATSSTPDLSNPMTEPTSLPTAAPPAVVAAPSLLPPTDKTAATIAGSTAEGTPPPAVPPSTGGRTWGNFFGGSSSSYAAIPAIRRAASTLAAAVRASSGGQKLVGGSHHEDERKEDEGAGPNPCSL